jgi:hypothetical protein
MWKASSGRSPENSKDTPEVQATTELKLSGVKNQSG